VNERRRQKHIAKQVGAEPIRLSETQRAALLEIAREAVDAAARGVEPAPPELSDPAFEQPAGAFVTLYGPGHRLRGCIGFIEAEHPLATTVTQAARSAASRDPRFHPVAPAEVPDLDISISVLSPTRPVRDLETIVVGRDGLIVRRGYRQGLLLPQVATERGWDRERFLEETCNKAGLPRDAWKDQNTEIYAFSAEIFGAGEEND
jgi:AmmeMemoRadiSam system protein A